MNIAIVTSEFITESNFDGGLANYNYKLAKLLQFSGHQPVIFVSSDRDEETVYDNIRVYKVKVTGYDDFFFSSKLFCKPYTKLKRYLKANTGYVMSYELRYQSRQLNRKFREAGKSMKFDLVHYSSLAAVGFYRSFDMPSIARISGSSIESQYLGGYGDTDIAVKAQQKLEYAALRKMDAVFGPSRMIAAMIGKQVKQEIRIIETPCYFPDISLNDELYRQIPEGKKYLLFFGTLGLIKGCGTIAEMIGDFFKRHPDYYFVFVGKVLASPDKKMDMLNYLKSKAGEHAGRIIHFGKTPHEKLFPLIRNSEFVVLPSRIDNFPNTCIEAMGHGKIVIGTNGNGFDQLIVNGDSGFLIDADDSKALLETISIVISLPEENKKRISRNAFDRIALLSPENIATQVLGFYSETIRRFNGEQTDSGTLPRENISTNNSIHS